MLMLFWGVLFMQVEKNMSAAGDFEGDFAHEKEMMGTYVDNDVPGVHGTANGSYDDAMADMGMSEQQLRAQRLSELEARLREPDAVMEPNILHTLRDYVHYEGDPREAVQLLTENYVGYAQMAVLACNWLQSLETGMGMYRGDEDDTTEPRTPPYKRARTSSPGSILLSHSVHQPLEAESSPAMKNQCIQSHNQDKVGPIEAEQHKMCETDVHSNESSGPSEIVVNKRERTEKIMRKNAVLDLGKYGQSDASWFLRELIVEQFDPRKLSEVMSQSVRKDIISNINELIEDSQGRQLIYRLAQEHPHSLLLSFALAKILKQPGRQEEVASAVTSFVGPLFDVYHTILGVRLQEAAKATSEKELQNITHKIAAGAIQDQHVYIHTQQMLLELASDRAPWSSRFYRISQEIESLAPVPARWKFWRALFPPICEKAKCSPGSRYDLKNSIENENSSCAIVQPNTAIAASAVADILSISGISTHVPVSEIIRLRQVYFGSENLVDINQDSSQGEDIPPLALIRHHKLLDMLIKSLFAPSKQLQLDVQKAHVDILAIAVAGKDKPKADACNGACISVEPLHLQPGVQRAQKSFRVGADLAHKAVRDVLLTDEEKLLVQDAVKEPAVALGILGLLRAILTSKDHWSTAYTIHKEPPFSPLIDAIIMQQPNLHDSAISLIADSLVALGESGKNLDAARALLSCSAKLVYIEGKVEDVLGWASRWSRTGDASLVRYLVLKILEGVSPPYSFWFATSMLKLAVAGNVRRQKMTAKEWNFRAPLLAEFAEGCHSVCTDKPLEWEEKALLRDLRSSLEKCK